MAVPECSYKYDWYQTNSHVTLTILKRGLSRESCAVNYNEPTLEVTIGSNENLFKANLFASINKSEITWNCTPSKVEIKLPKLVGIHWPSLTALQNTELNSTVLKSSQNWNELIKEVEKEEKETNGVDSLFKSIFKDADDDARKAMIKSYSESCGTVLSTNWNEIRDKKTEIKPPDDMEYRKYNS